MHQPDMNSSDTLLLTTNDEQNGENSSAESIAALIASQAGPILPVGARTKSALSASSAGCTLLDMRGHRGIVSYDPSEFLISAKAGTPLLEIQAVLDEQRQYLPFDPLFVSQAATLGGTVASGLSGAGRLLYGSLRDFVMEVQLIDGLGKIVRGGGKVVKNAAGFDLPKLVVGSYGRLGVLTEVTLKVFPRPPANATLQVAVSNVKGAIAAVQSLLAQPLPISALDLQFDRAGTVELLARFSAHNDSLAEVLRRAAEACGLTGQAVREASQEQQLWLDRAAAVEKHTAGCSRILVRVATTLPAFAELAPALLAVAGDDAELHCTGGGSVAWLSLADATPLKHIDQLLASHKIPAIVISAPDVITVDNSANESNAGLRPLGDRTWLSIARRIQLAMDPQERFAAYV